MRANAIVPVFASLWLIACGNSGLPPDSAFSEANAAEDTAAAKPAEKPDADKTADKPADKPDADKSADKADKPSDDSDSGKKSTGPEPNFTDNMSVEDAIKAAAGTERMNIDQEELSKPLTDPSLYESCKPGSAHFKLKVAIWRGKAVGIDLSTTPKNQKLTDCLKDKIKGVTWSAKVPSLNTVSFTY